MRSALRSPVTSQGPPPRPRPASPEPRLAGSRPLRPAPSRHLPCLPSPGLRVGRGLCLVSGTTPGSITGSRVCHLRCDRCPPAVNVTCALSSLAGLRARRLEHSLPGLTWGSCTLRAGVCVHVCVQVCVHLSLSSPAPELSGHLRLPGPSALQSRGPLGSAYHPLPAHGWDQPGHTSVLLISRSRSFVP